MDDCLHGMNPEWCATCRGDDSAERQGSPGAPSSHDTKQDQLDLLCDQLGLPRAQVSNGSSIPAPVLREAAKRCGVSTSGTMPEIAERIALKAGLQWTTEHDSRHTISSGGSTVTYPGMVQLNRAVASLTRH